MKQLLFSITLLLIHFVSHAQSPADLIIGTWQNEEQSTKIEIYKAGPSYFGKIVWLANPNDTNGKPKTDKNNPDASKRNQKITGMNIIWDLKFKNGKWTGGKVYTPKKGMYADCTLELPSKNVLMITASKGLFSKTKKWLRQ